MKDTLRLPVPEPRVTNLPRRTWNSLKASSSWKNNRGAWKGTKKAEEV